MITIDVHKQFAELDIHFSMELSPLRTILFGPSGSGKSTLLKLITGFYTPDRGKICIGNTILFDTERDINLPIHQRKIGYLPQNYTLFPHLDVRDNILYGLKASKIPYIERELISMATRLGIEEYFSALPSELSGGQQQRVALARIMLLKPQILLLDEPFSALDNAIRNTLRDLVLELCEDTQTPAILVTHDLEEALVFGQNIFVIQNGTVLEHARAEELFENPRYVETARLLGFQIWPLADHSGTTLLTVGGQQFVSNAKLSQGKQYVCIRPESIMLLREDRPVSDTLHENIIEGTVVKLRHRAHYIRIIFTAANGVQYILHTPKHVIKVMNIHKSKACRISLKKESLILCTTSQ